MNGNNIIISLKSHLQFLEEDNGSWEPQAGAIGGRLCDSFHWGSLQGTCLTDSWQCISIFFSGGNSRGRDKGIILSVLPFTGSHLNLTINVLIRANYSHGYWSSKTQQIPPIHSNRKVFCCRLWIHVFQLFTWKKGEKKHISKSSHNF